MKTPSLRSVGLALLLPLAALLPARASMIYYLPFDDGTNANLINYGTVSNGVAATTRGAVPAAVGNVAPNLGSTHAERTSGSTTRIDLPDSTTRARLDTVGQAMTISTWVYHDSAAQAFGGIVGNSGTGGGWNFSITNTGQLRIQFTGTGNTTISRATAASIIPTQSWVNVALTWNTSATGADVLAMYLNGTRVFNASTPSLMLASAEPISLLGNVSQVILDDFGMWDTALSAGQIRAISTAPTAISGFNLGKLNPLFTAHTAASPSTVNSGGIAWTYATGFDVTSKALGDTWMSNETYYIWLGGDSSNATGMIGTAIPEPSSVAMLAGLSALAAITLRRKRSR